MNQPRPFRIILTCEHGGNDVPDELRSYFDSSYGTRQLASHRGYDPGALAMARNLSQALHAELYSSTVSRLVVELNRSLDSPQLFSRFTRNLSPTLQQHILRQYYEPHRRTVETAIAKAIAGEQVVIHLSIHSFTARYRGSRRAFDIGILFDPSRPLESKLSARILDQLSVDGLRAHANRPYLGTDDGLTTHLRTVFPDTAYAGLEIELSNRIIKLSEKTQGRWCRQLVRALHVALL